MSKQFFLNCKAAPFYRIQCFSSNFIQVIKAQDTREKRGISGTDISSHTDFCEVSEVISEQSPSENARRELREASTLSKTEDPKKTGDYVTVQLRKPELGPGNAYVVVKCAEGKLKQSRCHHHHHRRRRQQQQQQQNKK